MPKGGSLSCLRRPRAAAYARFVRRHHQQRTVHTLTYTYSRPQLVQYFRHELWRTQGGFLIALPVLIAAIVLASLNNDYWWFAGFLAGVCLCYLLVLYSSYRHLDLFPVDVSMTVTLSDAGIHFQSALVTSDMPWAAIRATRRSPAGLALTSRITRRPVLLPAAVLTEEIIGFVERHVSQGKPGSL
jgi:hypothetical protein